MKKANELQSGQRFRIIHRNGQVEIKIATNLVALVKELTEVPRLIRRFSPTNPNGHAVR